MIYRMNSTTRRELQMSRKRKSDDDLFDIPDEDNVVESTNHLDKVMSLLEDAGIEYSVKKVANGKSLMLDNTIIFRFGHDGELTSVDK